MGKKAISPWLDFYATPDRRVIINPYAFGGPPPPFSPTDIAGLKLWLQGDNAPSGTVNAWPDNSGNGNDATDAGAPPTRVDNAINGHHSVLFDATYLTSNAAFTANMTVIVVVRLFGVLLAHIDAPFWGAAAGQGLGMFLTNTFGSGDQTYYAVEQATARFLDGSASSAPPGNFPLTDYAVASASGSGLTSTASVNIGRNTYGFPSKVEIAELIVYDSVLSTGDREAVEDYLGSKYAITITH